MVSGGRGLKNHILCLSEKKGKDSNMNEWEIFCQEEDAVGVVEIILILVVLIGLVVIFKDQLSSLVKSLLEKITKQSNEI